MYDYGGDIMKIKVFRLKCLIADKGLSTVEFTERAGISRNTLSSVFNGKSCSVSTAAQLAKALNVPLEEIVKGED